MNNLKIILLFSFLISFAACEDDTSSSDNLIVGTWEMVALDYSGVSEAEVIPGTTISSSFVGEAIEIDFSATFTENQISSEGSYTIELTTMSMGQTFVTQDELTDFVGDANYTIMDDILTSTQDGLESEVTIEVLTETELILSATTVQNIDVMGTNSTSTIDVRYILER